MKFLLKSGDFDSLLLRGKKDQNSNGATTIIRKKTTEKPADIKKDLGQNISKNSHPSDNSLRKGTVVSNRQGQSI